MVEKIASSFSARLIIPKKTLSVSEKIKLTKKYTQDNIFSNHHERDALASAVFAGKRIRQLMRRINTSLCKYGLSGNADAENHVKTSVLLHGENIANSINRFINIKLKTKI